MAPDHQLTFDWILYAILVPPVLVALWELVRTWNDGPRHRDDVRVARATLETPVAQSPSDRRP